MTAESGNTKNGSNGEGSGVPQRRRYTAEAQKPGAKPASNAAAIELDDSGFVTLWSSQAEQLYGYEPDEIVGKHFSSLYCRGELEQGRAVHELNAIKQRKQYNVFGWQQRKSGQQFWTYTEGTKTEPGYRLQVAETPHVE